MAALPVESLPVGEARRVLTDVQAAVHVDLSGIEESERTVESEGHTLRLNLVRPSGAGRVHLPAFVFIHGGGWVLGDYPTHRRLVRDLVVESGCAAVFVNYTPSPEAHFPKAVEEVYAAVKWVAENGREIGVDGSRLALAGNSVGGNMSLAAALVAEDHGGPRLRTLVLMWPVTDAGYDWDSYVKYGGQRFPDRAVDEMDVRQVRFRPGSARQRHHVTRAGLCGTAAGLLPTLIAVARERHSARRGRGDGASSGRGGRRSDDRALQRRGTRLGDAQRVRRVASDAHAYTAGRLRIAGLPEKIGCGPHQRLCRAALKQAGGAQQADGVPRRAGRADVRGGSVPDAPP